jgi:hypothetical protein
LLCFALLCLALPCLGVERCAEMNQLRRFLMKKWFCMQIDAFNFISAQRPTPSTLHLRKIYIEEARIRVSSSCIRVHAAYCILNYRHSRKHSEGHLQTLRPQLAAHNPLHIWTRSARSNLGGPLAESGYWDAKAHHGLHIQPIRQ